MSLVADDRAETYTLSDVRRFNTDWEAATSLRLRDGAGDAIAALAEYDRHVDCPDLDTAVASAARGVVADRLDGRTILAVADSNALAARVSVRVRDLLIEQGIITAAQAAQTVELGRDLVTASVGDEIEFRRIDRRLGVLNRGHATVTTVHDDTSLTARLSTCPGCCGRSNRPGTTRSQGLRRRLGPSSSCGVQRTPRAGPVRLRALRLVLSLCGGRCRR
jgi:hypothetical protein